MNDLNFEDLNTYLINQNGRIIHQVWFDTITNKKQAKKDFKSLKLYRDSWTIKNPTWARMIWNVKNSRMLIKTFFPEHLELYDSYKYEIQRCDTIRYFFLYLYGGFYVDMDYYCNKPLDDVRKHFDKDIYFVQSSNMGGNYISNSLMFSTPKHVYWKKIFINLEKSANTVWYYSKHLCVMYSTGPAFLNRMYIKYNDIFKVYTLPYKLFNPYGIGDSISSLKDNLDVYAIHIGKGSWEDKDSTIIKFFYINFRITIFILSIMFLPYFLLNLIKKLN